MMKNLTHAFSYVQHLDTSYPSILSLFLNYKIMLYSSCIFCTRMNIEDIVNANK